MKTAAVILAAGASTRLGTPKQLAVVGGVRLLERAIRTCLDAQLEPVVVVLGAHAETIQNVCSFHGVSTILNENWREGMGSSLREGIASVAVEDADAVIVLTCDMPFVDGRHLRALVSLAQQTGQNAASWYRGGRGVPACFLRPSFAALMNLGGDSGAKALLPDAPAVELTSNGDVDTPEQLLAAQSAATTTR